MHGHLLLGSNLDNPLRQLGLALEAMATRSIEVLQVSSYYETEPVGEVLDQPQFINAAAAIQTDLDPLELLDRVKSIEREFGRQTDVSSAEYVLHGPRILDIDIALLGDRSIASEQLTVPHPRLLERRFALIPLLELDFDLALPDSTRLSDALAQLPLQGQNVRRVRD